MQLNLQATFEKSEQSTQAALQALVDKAKGYAQHDGDTAGT